MPSDPKVPLLTIHPLDGHDGAAEAAAAGGGGTGGSGSVLLAQAGAALTLSKLKAALAAAGGARAWVVFTRAREVLGSRRVDTAWGRMAHGAVACAAAGTGGHKQ